MVDYDLINKSFPEFRGKAKEVGNLYPDQDSLVRTKSDVDSLLDVVYGTNPETGWPTGDYTMFMSEKCSPEVREFIKQNLMSPISVDEKTSDVPDDVLMDCCRGKHESLQEYVGRMTRLAEDGKFLYQKEQYIKEHKSE